MFMLKSIEEFLYYILEYVAPRRFNFALVKNLNEDDISQLPRADAVVGMDWIHPIFKYKDYRVKAIIWELKYRQNTLPLEHIGKIIYEEILPLIYDISLFNESAEFLLIPVPITNQRRSERGYNQSEYIAKTVLENDLEHCLLYTPQWLQKTRETPRQSHSESKEDRIKNLIGSFEADPRVENKYIILIDDVVTTGSTLREVRKTLMEAGTKEVYAFTIAH
ncbi:MAG: phosphoribosyltransferase family protein [Parcubacteria group bacterium]